jgi:hypothetical protein
VPTSSLPPRTTKTSCHRPQPKLFFVRGSGWGSDISSQLTGPKRTAHVWLVSAAEEWWAYLAGKRIHLPALRDLTKHHHHPLPYLSPRVCSRLCWKKIFFWKMRSHRRINVCNFLHTPYTHTNVWWEYYLL